MYILSHWMRIVDQCSVVFPLEFCTAKKYIVETIMTSNKQTDPKLLQFNSFRCDFALKLDLKCSEEPQSFLEQCSVCGVRMTPLFHYFLVKSHRE